MKDNKNIISETKKDTAAIENANLGASESKSTSQQHFEQMHQPFAFPKWENPILSTKWGRTAYGIAKGFVRFYADLFKHAMKLVNWLLNATFKLAVICTFLIALSWYCQQNPEFAAWLNTLLENLGAGFQNAVTIVKDIIHSVCHF